MKIHDVEQGKPEWFALRCGIPTASEFSKLITSTGSQSKSMEVYAYQKACEKFAEQRVDAFSGSKWTDAGTEDEEAEREHYQFTTGYEVTQVGFVTLDDGSCGCSPDGLVNDDGLLELKRMKGNLLVEAHLYYKAKKMLLPKFVQQIQGQIWITERDWCDVEIYNPLLPTLSIHVDRDPRIIAALQVQVMTCNRLRDETIRTLGW